MRHLPELLAAVEAGETVTIVEENGRTFTLSIRPHAQAVNPDWPGYPYAGSAKGLIVVPDDFDEPLEELRGDYDVTRLWRGPPTDCDCFPMPSVDDDKPTALGVERRDG